MPARARLAGVGTAAWLCTAALAGAQVQVWATRYDSGPITAQDATLGGGDRYRGKHAIATDAAGETYATGTVNKYSDTDCLTVKYNAAGTVVWSAVFDGSSTDTCYASAVDGVGGVYVTGTAGTIKYDAATGAQLWASPAAGVALAWDGTGLVVAGVGGVRRFDAAGVQQWAQALPGEARAIALDGAGNVHVAVVENSGANDDFGVRKFDAAGTPLWARLYNGSGNAADEVHDIGVDGAGGVYVTGSCANAANGDACTVKYDAAGTQQWAAVYNGGDADSGNALVVDATGVYVTGWSRTASSDDFLTLKYTPAGATSWTRLYDDGDTDAAYAIGLDGAGAVRVTGSAFHGSELDFRTVKYSAAGAQLWAASFSMTANGHDVPFSLAVDAAGNAITAGYSLGTTGGAQGSQFRLVKHDTAGVQQWTRPNPGVSIDPEDRPTSRNAMAADASGNVYVLGRTFNGQNTDFRLVKHDPAGAVAWTRTVAGNGGLDEPEAVAVDAAGNVYVTGTITTSGNAGTNFATAKYDTAGTQLWLTTHNNGSSDLARALAVDGSGNVYVTGQSWNGAHYEYRTVKYNAAGVQQWAQSAGAAGEDLPAAIAVDPAGNVYVTGSWFNGSNHDYRTVKYNAAGTLQWNVVEAGPANGADVASALAVDAAGNVYVTGSSVQATSALDFFTVKYGPTGTLLWSASHDGGANADDTAAELVLDAAGNVYVGGTAAAAGGDTDFAVVKYDGSGAQQWVATSTRAGADAATDLTLDAAGNAYVTGQAATGTGLDYRTVKFDAAGAEQWAAAFTGPGAREDRAVAVVVDALANVYVTGVSRDQDGNDFVTIKYGGDSTAPTNPAVASTSHAPSTWSNVGAIAMQWSGAADNAGGSGLAGYSHLFDTTSGTTPDTTVDTPHTADPHSTVSASLPDGASHYFHLRACDVAGNCAPAVEAGPYFIDRTDPQAPTGLASTSHVPSTPSADTTIDIAWSAAVDPLANGVASGIDGYSYFFDSSSSPSCDFAKDVEEGTTTATSTALANGTWYAHVCARDNAGNWSALATAGPYLIEDQADLSIVKADSADPVNASTDFSYTLAVSNAGPSTAQSLTVTDVLPAGLTFVSVAGTNWTCGQTNGTVTCTRASLPVGPAEPITITVNAPAEGGAVTNTATVSASTADPAAANNSDSETTAVGDVADLSITKSDGQTVVVPGQSITYTITVANAGPSPVTGSSVSDPLPAALQGATWTCSASSGSSCTASGAGNIGDTVDLLAGGTATYTLTATVGASAGALVNTASVTAPATVTDPNSANDSATDADTVVDPLAVEGELGHGTRLVADLASLGVNADEDRFRIHQDPLASYEVTVDAASGDLGANGLVLERVAADGVTVLQTSRAVGLGSARTLRWTNTTTAAVDDEWVRVKSAGCASDCGADDTYRIRAWETSGRLPRFNNSASQVTVLLLQNPTTETISGRIYFWNPAGSQVADVPFSLDAHQVLVLNTATLAGGLSGSATVVHDGPYGGLVGKAVALEPATGFSFDSPLGARLR